MIKVKITQIKSKINRPERQKATLLALGLGKINRTRIHNANPQIMGMIRAVSHLIKVEEVK